MEDIQWFSSSFVMMGLSSIGIHKAGQQLDTIKHEEDPSLVAHADKYTSDLYSCLVLLIAMILMRGFMMSYMF